MTRDISVSYSSHFGGVVPVSGPGTLWMLAVFICYLFFVSLFFSVAHDPNVNCSPPTFFNKNKKGKLFSSINCSKVSEGTTQIFCWVVFQGGKRSLFISDLLFVSSCFSTSFCKIGRMGRFYWVSSCWPIHFFVSLLIWNVLGGRVEMPKEKHWDNLNFRGKLT